MPSPTACEKFKAIFLMPISNVLDKLKEKKQVASPTFSCSDDPLPVTWKLKVGFGTKEENCLAVAVKPTNRTVNVNSYKFVVFNDDMVELKELNLGKKFVASRGSYRGLKNVLDLQDTHTHYHYYIRYSGELRVMVEIDYDGIPEGSPVESTTCVCPQPSHLKTLSQNMLDLFSESRNADITLVVGGEKVKAHKSILAARSTYFQNLFEPNSNWKESRADEIVLDEDPVAFKEALKFLYSGMPDENLERSAIEVLPIADKYCLDELKQFCLSAIQQNVSANDVITVLQLAENHHCVDLFHYCVPLLKANAKNLKKDCIDKLQTDPKLLFKLLQICSE